VSPERHGGHRQAGAVDVQGEPVLACRACQRAQLVARVQRAELGRLRDRDGPRLHAMRVADVAHASCEQLRGQLAVGGGDEQQLAPEIAFGGAALV
jgi:hypothetical protein